MGWQKQKYTDATIQEHIETSIRKLLNEDINIIGAGRTDSGVSAYNQVANFKFNKVIELDKFNYSLNSILPDKIAVKKILRISPDFHSRYSAVRREYLYKMTFRKKAIEEDSFYKIKFNIDFKKMDAFIKFILNTTFFRSFCKNKEDKNNYRCLVHEFKYKLIKSKDELIFTITANRFLHSMIRSILGCCLDIGREKLILNNIKEQLEKGEKIAVNYLPANALFLNKIYY